MKLSLLELIPSHKGLEEIGTRFLFYQLQLKDKYNL